MARPEFLKALRLAQHPGTEFVVWKLDRMGRTLEGIIEVLRLLETRGIKFFSLTERVDMTTPMGKAMLQMMAVVAELERNLIVERTKAARICIELTFCPKTQTARPRASHRNGSAICWFAPPRCPRS